MSEEKTLSVPAETGVMLANVSEGVAALVRQMQTMADMIRVTNERMAAMEQTIRTLEKVTPAQAAEINAAMRARAREVCAAYRMVSASGPDPDAVKAVTAAIRKEVRLMTGAKTSREISRCDYRIVMDTVRDWDDYEVIGAIRERRRKG